MGGVRIEALEVLDVRADTSYNYTFGKKLRLLPGKNKHLPFKINEEVKTYKVDENLHNLILPTIVVIITSLINLVSLKYI